MALPRTINFAQVTILLGNGASPEVFAQPCGMTSKSISFDGKSSSVIVPDCDNPLAPAWEDKAVSALSGQVQGEGIVSMADLTTWVAWFASGTDKNLQIWFNLPNSEGGGYWSGAGILSKLDFDTKLASEGNRATIKFTIESDGAWPWTNNPA